MAWNINDRVKEILDVSKEEATAIIESARIESKQAGHGLLATDKGIVSEPAKTGRRNFLLWGLAGGFSALLYAADKSVDFAVSDVSNLGLISGLFKPTVPAFSFDEPFLDFMNKHRENKDLNAAKSHEPGSLKDEFIDFLIAFRNGYRLTVEEALRLKDLADAASNESTKLLLTDLLTSHFLRLGGAELSREYFKKIDPAKLRNATERLVYIEKELSHCYTVIQTDNALKPENWGFENAIALARDIGVSEVGINIKTSGQGFDISIPRDVIVGKDSIFSGVKGHYVINLLLHYAASKASPDDSKELADLQISVLRRQAAQPGLIRSAWNMAFTNGLLYHRRGLAFHSRGDFAVRDKFFDICFNQAGNGWPDFPDRVSDQRLSAGDPAAIAMVFTIMCERRAGKTDKKRRLKTEYRGIASPNTLLDSRGDIFALSLQRAIDQLRVEAGRDIDDGKSISLYTGDDKSLSIYLPALDEIRSSVRT